MKLFTFVLNEGHYAGGMALIAAKDITTAKLIVSESPYTGFVKWKLSKELGETSLREGVIDSNYYIE